MKKIYTMCLAALMMTSVNEANAITVDDLVGDYAEVSSGSDYWNYYTWNNFNYNGGVTISKVDETTITMSGLYGWWVDTDDDGYYDTPNALTGKVDLEAGTITFEAQLMDQWYYFCASNYVSGTGYTSDQPVVATFDVEKGSISFDNWAMVYPEWSTAYVNWGSTYLYKYDWWAEGSYDTGEFNTDKEVDGTAWIYGLKDGSYLITDMLPNGKYLLFVPGEDGTWGDPWGSYWVDPTYGDYYFYGMFQETRPTDTYDNMGNPIVEDLNVVIDDYFYVIDNKFNFDPENGELSFDYEYYYSANSAKPEYEGTYKLTWTTSGGDDTDGIASVKTGNGIEAPVYSISGVRVTGDRNALPRGLYISDGKKFVVK